MVREHKDLKIIESSDASVDSCTGKKGNDANLCVAVESNESLNVIFHLVWLYQIFGREKLEFEEALVTVDGDGNVVGD